MKARVGSVLVAIGLFAASVVSAQDRALRAMDIHSVPEIGLEVWVEQEPPWEAMLARQGKKVQYVVESPDHYHPTTALIYSTYRGVSGDYPHLKTVAQTAVRTAAAGYGAQDSEQISVRSARYGKLSGYEADFEGRLNGLPIEVRLFIGGQAGKPLVTAQAITQPGKLRYLSEVLRRAWTNLSYL